RGRPRPDRRCQDPRRSDEEVRSPTMKKGIHPEYRPVVFQDTAANFSFLTRSTVKTNDTVVFTDGQTYPLVKLDISSASHPFYTGKMKFLDTTGQVEKFKKKYQKTGIGKPAAEEPKA